MLPAETLATLLIAAGALFAAARLLWLRRDWRGGVLAVLTLASGLLLYLTLFPPQLPIGGEVLLVATAETPPGVRVQPGERLVALPEAPPLAAAERVPDLATALRRHRHIQRIRVLGRGLPQRDRDGDAGLPVQFSPLPLPRGLIRLDPPADAAAGAIFTLSGEAAQLEGGSAELLDPAGQPVDRRVIGSDGNFTLGGTARVPGLALFTVRLRGRDTAIVSETPVPLRTYAEQPFRALLIGAPSPDMKYLQRWAIDAGMEVQSRLDAGAGVDLGQGGARIDAAGLRDVDVVIIDDQALAATGAGGRAVLARAVEGGLGVVVRMTAPATPGARATWRTLGLAVDGGSEVASVALPPLAADEDALVSRRGPGTADVPGSINALDDPAPDLGRWVLRTGPEFVPVVTDAEGGMVSGWQQRQRGRIAVWAAANSFALVLSGEADRYQQWWSDTVSAVARPGSLFRPQVPSLASVGARTAICGIAPSARVTAPDGDEVALAIDPAAGASGCAAYWPVAAGVHTIIQDGSDGRESFAFMVLPEAAQATIAMRETGETTARWAARQTAPDARVPPEQRGAAWPWFLGWLIVSGALWLAERRLRRSSTAPQLGQ